MNKDKKINLRFSEKILNLIYKKIGENGNLSEFIRIAVEHELNLQNENDKLYKKMLKRFDELNLHNISNQIRETSLTNFLKNDEVLEKLAIVNENIKLRTPEFIHTQMKQELKDISQLTQNTSNLINSNINWLIKDVKELFYKINNKVFIWRNVAIGLTLLSILICLIFNWNINKKLNNYNYEKTNYSNLLLFINHSCTNKQAYAKFIGKIIDCNENIY